MKKIIKTPGILMLTILASSFLYSCGGGEKTLDDLRKEKESLLAKVGNTKGELADIEEQILKLDTANIKVDLPKVTVVHAERKVFEHYFEVQGNIEAAKNIILLPEAGGIIKSINVQEGQMIQAGQTVATFDSDVIASNMKELEEQLSLAVYMYEKQKSLYDQGVGTEIALKQAEGQYLALEKTMNTLKTQKGKFILSAPFSGYVEEVFPVVGEMAGPASPIIRLINLDKIAVKADISESYLSKIKESSKVNVFFPALDEKKEGLSIKRVGKFINPVNRTVSVEVEIPSPSDKHVPNLMAVLEIRDYIDTNAIVVPSNVIMESAKGNPIVKILSAGNIVELREIETGVSYKGSTEIISGLKEGDTVISNGKGSVVVGQEVEKSDK